MIPDKKRRYERNKKIRAYYGAQGPYLDLQNESEEMKDYMYKQCVMKQINPLQPSSVALDNLEVATSALQVAQQCTMKYIDPRPYLIEENTMNTNTTSFETERRALLTEVDRFECETEDTLRHHFAIDPYKAKSAKELVTLIKEDKFDFGDYEKQADDPEYFANNWISPCSVIRLMPKEVDKTGYSKAVKELRTSTRDTKLEIKVLDPEKGLEKVKALKKRTFH